MYGGNMGRQNLLGKSCPPTQSQKRRHGSVFQWEPSWGLLRLKADRFRGPTSKDMESIFMLMLFVMNLLMPLIIILTI